MKRMYMLALLVCALLLAAMPALAEDVLNQNYLDRVEYADHVEYNDDIWWRVSRDGTTTACITDDAESGIIWLKEESDGTSTWYGLDNSQGVFGDESWFWVKWLSERANASEWAQHYSNFDDVHKNKVEDDNMWIFLIGVMHPGGEEYIRLDKKVPVYIQLGDDWDHRDLQARFISSGDDEIVNIRYIDGMRYPEGTGDFAVVDIAHFSPYAIYDLISSGAAVSGLPKTGDASRAGLWLALLMISAAAGGVLLTRRRKTE